MQTSTTDVGVDERSAASNAACKRRYMQRTCELSTPAVMWYDCGATTLTVKFYDCVSACGFPRDSFEVGYCEHFEKKTRTKTQLD